MTAFHSEATLARAGRRLLRSAIENAGTFDDVRTRREVRAPGGVPDLVVFRRKAGSLLYVITIEFKLQNWKRALNQAFRHRNFGNEAYVVIDAARSRNALAHIGEFRRANIGLVLMDTFGSAKVSTYPEPQVPFSIRFSKELARSLLAPRRSLPEDLPFTRTVRGGICLSGFRKFLGTEALASDLAEDQV